MEIAAAAASLSTHFLGLNPQINVSKKTLDLRIRCPCFHHVSFQNKERDIPAFTRRRWNGILTAVSPGLEHSGVLSSSFKDVTVIANEFDGREIKVKFNVSAEKRDALFDDVFSKLVAAAQPIPGFRRVKGGKTPDIPKEILLHILGPSKVNKQCIKKIINSTVAKYVEKEGLKVTQNLRIEQSYEELESTFKPGRDFSFNAVIELVEEYKK